MMPLKSLRMPVPPVFDIVMVPVAVLETTPLTLLTMPKPAEFDIVMMPELVRVPVGPLLMPVLMLVFDIVMVPVAVLSKVAPEPLVMPILPRAEF